MRSNEGRSRRSNSQPIGATNTYDIVDTVEGKCDVSKIDNQTEVECLGNSTANTSTITTTASSDTVLLRSELVNLQNLLINSNSFDDILVKASSQVIYDSNFLIIDIIS